MLFGAVVICSYDITFFIPKHCIAPSHTMTSSYKPKGLIVIPITVCSLANIIVVNSALIIESG